MFPNYINPARGACYKAGIVAVGRFESLKKITPSFGFGGEGIWSVDVIQRGRNGHTACHDDSVLWEQEIEKGSPLRAYLKIRVTESKF
jgi:hypothetical protein